jgi:hypothetical protein
MEFDWTQGALAGSLRETVWLEAQEPNKTFLRGLAFIVTLRRPPELLRNRDYKIYSLYRRLHDRRYPPGLDKKTF